MQAEMPFYEGIEDALAACVKALGGSKVVGGRLWPDKPALDAQTLMANCINPTRKEKLDYTQIIYLFREAKNAGCYGPYIWLSNEIGYDARPITKAEEVDRLTLVVEQASKTLATAAAALERIQRTSSIRAA